MLPSGQLEGSTGAEIGNALRRLALAKLASYFAQAGETSTTLLMRCFDALSPHEQLGIMRHLPMRDPTRTDFDVATNAEKSLTIHRYLNEVHGLLQAQRHQNELERIQANLARTRGIITSTARQMREVAATRADALRNYLTLADAFVDASAIDPALITRFTSEVPDAERNQVYYHLHLLDAQPSSAAWQQGEHAFLETDGKTTTNATRARALRNYV